MNSNKSGTLTMCRKAGKLVMGMDMVKQSCNIREAKAVFTAMDISEKSLKEARFVCAKNDIPLYRLDMTMDDIWYSLGKKLGIMAMTDAGFAKSCSKGLEQIQTDKSEFDL